MPTTKGTPTKRAVSSEVVVVDVVAAGFAAGFTATVVAARSVFDSAGFAVPVVAVDVDTPICLILGAANALVPKIANIANMLVKSFDIDIFPSFVFVINFPFKTMLSKNKVSMQDKNQIIKIFDK